MRVFLDIDIGDSELYVRNVKNWDLSREFYQQLGPQVGSYAATFMQSSLRGPFVSVIALINIKSGRMSEAVEGCMLFIWSMSLIRAEADCVKSL